MVIVPNKCSWFKSIKMSNVSKQTQKNKKFYDLDYNQRLKDRSLMYIKIMSLINK